MIFTQNVTLGGGGGGQIYINFIWSDKRQAGHFNYAVENRRKLMFQAILLKTSRIMVNFLQYIFHTGHQNSK